MDRDDVRDDARDVYRHDDMLEQVWKKVSGHDVSQRKWERK